MLPKPSNALTNVGGSSRRENSFQSARKAFLAKVVVTSANRTGRKAKVTTAAVTVGRRVRRSIMMTRLRQILRRVRTARMVEAMNRWRLTCLQRQQAAVEEGRPAAVAEMRALVIRQLVEARNRRQLRHGFHLLIEHGAWAIYWSKERDAHRDRQSRGFDMLERAFARHRQRSKFIALSGGAHLLQKSGGKTTRLSSTLLGKDRERKHWFRWSRGGPTPMSRVPGLFGELQQPAAAGAQEDQRVSADLRVVQASRIAGVRLLISALSSARRRTLAKAWVIWSKEKRAAAEAELRSIDNHFHLARTLGRVKRRVELARMDQALREWRKTVVFESQAEMQAMKRNYNTAQTLTGVARWVEKRRLAKAWRVWARLAARGLPRLSDSLLSFPVGFPATARSGHVPPLAMGKADPASSSVSRPVHAAEPRKNAEKNITGAVALRGILRRAEVRSLLRSWRTLRAVTMADATRESKTILGARRLCELLTVTHKNHMARAVQRCWRKWTEWSMAESARLEQAEDTAPWARAEDEEMKMKAAAGADVLAHVTRLCEMRALRSRLIEWLDAVKITTHERNGVIGTEDPQERGECALEDYGWEGRHPATSPVTVGALRRKLGGEGSPIVPKLPRAPFEIRRSPNGFMVDGSPSPRRRKVCITNPPEDDVNDDMSTTSQARAWLGDASRSSLEFSMSGPSSTAFAGRSLSESASPITAISDTDHGSLGLSTSQESGITSGSRSGIMARSRAFASRSSPDGIDILSDSSSLLGVRILQNGGGAGTVKRTWANGNAETVVRSPDGIGFATITETLERSYVGRFGSSSDLGGGTRNPQLPRAPPFVTGPVHSWSLICESPARDIYEGDEEQDGERGQVDGP